MLTSTWGSRPKLSTPARLSPCRCCRIRRTATASLSSAVFPLGERVATTSSGWAEGGVWTWKPASAAVSSSTITVRMPSEMRALPTGNGGGNTRQMATMTTSARTPAPRNRGRVSSNPTVEGQPFGHHNAESCQGDPRPDLELAVVGRLHRRRSRRRKREPVGWLELRNRIRKQVHTEPGALYLAGDDLLHGVEARGIRVAERRDRSGCDRPPAGVRPDHAHRRRAGLRHDRDGLVGMEAVTGDAGGQEPLTQVLDEDSRGDPKMEVGLVQIQANQHLTKRLVAREHERCLQTADQGPAEGRAAQVLTAGDVNVLQVVIGQQWIRGVDSTDAPDADRLAAGQGGPGRRIDHDERAVRQQGWGEA